MRLLADGVPPPLTMLVQRREARRSLRRLAGRAFDSRFLGRSASVGGAVKLLSPVSHTVAAASKLKNRGEIPQDIGR